MNGMEEVNGNKRKPESTAESGAGNLRSGLEVKKTGLLMFLMFWMFISLGRPQDIFGILKPLHLGNIAAACTILLAMSQRFKLGKIPLTRFLEGRIILALFVLSVLSVPLGIYPRQSLYFIRDNLFTEIVYFVFLTWIIDRVSDLRIVATTLVLSAAVLATSSIVLGDESLRFYVGTTYDPNDLGLLLVVMLPVSNLLIEQKSSTFARMLSIYNIVASLYAIILTQSRGAFLALVVVGAALMFKKTGSSTFRRLAFIGLAVIVFSSMLTESYSKRIESLFKSEQTGSGRSIIWKRSLILMKDYPIGGVGIGNFISAYGRYNDAGKFPRVDAELLHPSAWKTAHNSFLLIGTELGIPGFLLYILLIVSAYRSMLVTPVASRHGPEVVLSAYGNAFSISLIGFIIGSTFLSQCYSALLYTLIGLAVIVQSIHNRFELDAKQEA